MDTLWNKTIIKKQVSIFSDNVVNIANNIMIDNITKDQKT